jgi:hypothetical protein
MCVIHEQCNYRLAHTDSSDNVEQMMEKGVKEGFWDLAAAEMRQRDPVRREVT